MQLFRQQGNSEADEDEEEGGQVVGRKQRRGWLRRQWELLRDICDIIQASKTFQHLTTAIIVINAIILAIVW